MWHFFSLKDRHVEALLWALIFTGLNSLFKILVNTFCNMSSTFNKWEGMQLWCHCYNDRPTHKDSQLWAGKNNDRCSWPSKNHHWYDSKALRSFRVHCHWPKLIIYLKVLVIAMLLFRHLDKVLDTILSIDKRPNQEEE